MTSKSHMLSTLLNFERIFVRLDVFNFIDFSAQRDIAGPAIIPTTFIGSPHAVFTAQVIKSSFTNYFFTYLPPHGQASN